MNGEGADLVADMIVLLLPGRVEWVFLMGFII